MELADCRTLIRYCFTVAPLSEIERFALREYLAETPEREACVRVDLSRGGVWMARQRAFEKMRAQFALLGIRSSTQLLSGVGVLEAGE